MSSYTVIALTNAKEGGDDAFNEWYSGRHLDDLLKIPGVIGVQRFHLPSLQRAPGPQPWRYAAIFDVETSDLGSVIGEMKRRSGTDAMPVSSALSGDALISVFEAHTERRTG